jgi:hypothetical protein
MIEAQSDLSHIGVILDAGKLDTIHLVQLSSKCNLSNADQTLATRLAEIQVMNIPLYDLSQAKSSIRSG